MQRKIDELGRFVIPIEMRNQLGINADDIINIEIHDDKIIMFKSVGENILCNVCQKYIQATDYYCKHCGYKNEKRGEL